MNFKHLFSITYFVMMFGLVVIGVSTVVKHIDVTYFNDVKTLVIEKDRVGLLTVNGNQTRLVEGDTYLSTDSVIICPIFVNKNKDVISEMEATKQLAIKNHEIEYNKCVKERGLEYANSIRKQKESLSIQLVELVTKKIDILLVDGDITIIDKKIALTGEELNNLTY